MTFDESARIAGLFDDVIVALGASDLGMPTTTNVAFMGYRSGFDVIRNEMRQYGLSGDSMVSPELLPSESHILFPESSWSRNHAWEITSVLKLPYHSRRFLSLSIRDHEHLFGMEQFANLGLLPWCTSTTRYICDSGRVAIAAPLNYVFWHGAWMPAGTQHYATSKRKRTTFRHNEWRTWEVLESTAAQMPEFAIMSEWATRYCWSVVLRLQGSPGLIIATDPIGVRELLALRDNPGELTRRQALVHWVREHWRQNRTDADIEHRVSAHLRGQSECDWFGLHCTVQPSRIDVAKAAVEKSRGRLWRRKNRDAITAGE